MAIAHDEIKKTAGPAARRDLNDMALDITKEMLKKINEMLEETKPVKLIKGLEAFVALLRNREAATSIDVKLYLLDFEKLQFKLRTINGEKLKAIVVKKAIDNMKDCQSGFPSDFSVIIEWAQQFAVYADYHINAAEIETKVKELEYELARIEEEIRVSKELLDICNDPIVNQFYNDTESKNHMVSMLDDCSKQQANFATDAQFKYTSFVNKSICRLNDERQLASKIADSLINKVNAELGKSDITKSSKRSMFE